MKYLIFISLLLLSSCYYLETGKFNQEAHDEYLQKSRSIVDMIDRDMFYVDMNKPSFEFHLDTGNFGKVEF